MSQATSYYCNNVRKGAVCNKLMALMLKALWSGYQPERQEHVPYYDG